MRSRQRASGWRRKVPVPVHGTWKTLLRIHDGRTLTADAFFELVDRMSETIFVPLQLPSEERHGFVWVVLQRDQPIDVAAHLAELDDEIGRLGCDKMRYHPSHAEARIDSAGVLQLLRYANRRGMGMEDMHFRDEHKALVSTIEDVAADYVNCTQCGACELRCPNTLFTGDFYRFRTRTVDLVKAVRALHMRKEREATGRFLAEGLKFIGEALDQDRAPKLLLVGVTFRHARMVLHVVVEDYVHDEGWKFTLLIANIFFAVAVTLVVANRTSGGTELLEVLKRVDQRVAMESGDTEIIQRLLDTGYVEEDEDGVPILSAAGVEMCKSLQHRIAADKQAAKILAEREGETEAG